MGERAGKQSGRAHKGQRRRDGRAQKTKKLKMTVRRIGCGGTPASFKNRGGHRSRAAEPSSRSQEWLAVAERPNALRTGAAERTTERLSRAAERREEIHALERPCANEALEKWCSRVNQCRMTMA